jgi:hypothetical protein
MFAYISSILFLPPENVSTRIFSAILLFGLAQVVVERMYKVEYEGHCHEYHFPVHLPKIHRVVVPCMTRVAARGHFLRKSNDDVATTWMTVVTVDNVDDS